MKCLIMFSRKNKKDISKYCLMKFLPSMQSVNISEMNGRHHSYKSA